MVVAVVVVVRGRLEEEVVGWRVVVEDEVRLLVLVVW